MANPNQAPVLERPEFTPPIGPEDAFPPPAEFQGHASREQLADQLGSFSIVEATGTDHEAAQLVVEQARTRVRYTLERQDQRLDRLSPFVPSVAGAIAQHSDPSVEFATPSAAQIKQESFLARTASRFLEWFGLGERFDAYLERTARQRIVRVAQRVTAPLDVIGSIDNPRARFLSEIRDMHQYLQRKDETGETGKPVPPEKKIPLLVRQIAELRSPHVSKETPVSPDHHAMLGRLLPSLSVPLHIAERQRTLKATSPEIMRGIEQFLNKHGSQVTAIEFAPFRSLTRRVIQKFASQRLSRLPNEIETALTQAYEVLPENGQKFAKSVYTLAGNVAELAKHGVDGRTITKALLKDLWR